MSRAAALVVAALCLAGIACRRTPDENGVAPPFPRGQVKSGAGERDQFLSLPYLAGTADSHLERRGVLVDRLPEGDRDLNLYCAADDRACILIDRAGRERWRWRFPPPGNVDHAELWPNGDLLALAQDHELIKVDSASNVMWRSAAEVHHTFWLRDGGEILVLARRRATFAQLHPAAPVWEDLILRLGEDGRLLSEISVLRALLASRFATLLPVVAHLALPEGGEDSAAFDLLHTNHVAELDGALAPRSSLFARGNLLVAMRNINAVAILDPSGSEVLWLWGPSNLAYPHHPSLLPNGRMLVFNNGFRGASEVLELDPLGLRFHWRYAPGAEFFSPTRGSCERLPSGNTLITESDPGYVLEVNPAGETVWEWANPRFLPDGRRAFVWRMTRYGPDRLTFLTTEGSGATGRESRSTAAE